MNQRRFFLRFLIGVTTLALSGAARAETPDEEIAATITELTESATPLRKDAANGEMMTLIDELRESHALDEAATTRLTTAAKKAVDDSLPLWSEDFSGFLTLQMERMAPRYYYRTDNLLRQLQNERAASIVERFQSVSRVRPESQEAWTAVLSEVLGKKNFAEWKAARTKKETEVQQSVSTFLDDYFREPFQKQKAIGTALVGDLVKTINAEEALKAKIDALMAEAHQAHFREQRSETGYVLERTLAERWPSFVGFFHGFDPERSEIWRQGLADILSEAQQQKWNTRRDEIRREAEAKFTNVMAASESAIRPQFEASMERAMEIVTTAAAPDEAAASRLKAAAEAAVDASLAGWREAGLTLFRRLPPETREALIQSNRFQHAVGADDDPVQQAPWQEALAAVLRPEQMAAYQAETAKREEEEKLIFAEMIDNTAETYIPQVQTQIDPRIADLINTLELDEKRADAFRQAGEAAVKETLEVWKQRARDWLEQMPPEQRRNYTEQGHVPLGINADDRAENQPAWSSAFDAILSAEERERWNRVQETRARDRTETLARLLVAQIETWVGFSEEQWPALARLCRKPAGSLSSMFEQQHYYLGVQQIAQSLKQIDDESLRKTLSKSQHQRWKEAVALLEQQNRSSRGELIKKAQVSPPPPGPSPRYIEQVISEFLYERNRAYKQSLLMRVAAEIEVVGEATNLNEESIARLHTAAKGAVEETTRMWDANFSKYARRRAQGANPKTIHQQLAGVGNYNTRETEPLQTTLWKRALAVHLEPAQRERWQSASLQRETLRRDAIAGMVAAYFESRFGINERQSPTFRKLLSTSLETYGPDIERIFSSSSSPWYLQYYSVGLPLMGVPEKDLKSLLSKEQHEIWETHFQSNAANYWDNVQRYHEQRMKEEKTATEKES